jgi:2'-hydroxyisoflavone reductase
MPSSILIIGGSRFSGHFATNYALSRGHKVTLFNRGKSSPEVPAGVEHISGDRDADIELLRGRTWDAVIDTCGYVPRVVRKSADLLKESVGHYIFISSISVYADPIVQNGDEDAPLASLADPSVEEVTGETYGGLKVLCEQVVQEVFSGRSTIVRPGLIVGPRDQTYRFNYWVERIARGGEMIAPGKPENPVQLIDARDLGEWLVRLAETPTTGVMNATGPADRLTWETFFTTSRQSLGSDTSFTWVDDDFLLQHEVQPWSELPVWLPGPDGNVHTCSIDRALAAGLTFRPLADTIQATREWMQSHPNQPPADGTLAGEKEARILAEWHARPK